MRWFGMVVGAVLVLAFVGITLWKRPDGALPEGSSQGEMSAERKAEIRRFWAAYNRATELKLQGAWADAEAAFRNALEVNPWHEGTLYGLGNVLFEQGQYGDAIVAWRRLVEANPSSARGYAQLGMVYSCRAPGAPFDLDVAERAFAQALDLNREETGPVLKLGEVALLKGDGERALARFETVARSNVKSVEAHYLLGYLHWRSGNEQAARVALQKAVQFSRGSRSGDATGTREGDTRTSGPMLAEGPIQKSFFAPFYRALKQWHTGDVTLAEMAVEYRKLDGLMRDVWQMTSGGL